MVLAVGLGVLPFAVSSVVLAATDIRLSGDLAVDAEILTLADSPEKTLVALAGPWTIDELRAREALFTDLRERIEQGEEVPDQEIREAAALGAQAVAVFRTRASG